ncbi:MAG: hypothetical protein V1754_12975 [Pseudomonadota bacterium]
MFRALRSITNLMVLLCAVGCGEAVVGEQADGGGNNDIGTTPAIDTSDGPATNDLLGESDQLPATGGIITIYVEGDTSTKSFSDGLSGQTPKEFTMSLGQFDIMTSASDPNPVTIFDHGSNPVDVDMLGHTKAGEGQTKDIPAGTYTHGQVLLTKTVFKIDGTVHATLAFPGEIQVIGALSDTTINGESWKQGQATYTFSLVPQPIPATLPLLPSTAGGTIIQKNGQTWMVFSFDKPISIPLSKGKNWEGTITYEVFKSFRWQDEQKTGYKDGVFDVTALPAPSYEPVMNFGATGYRINTRETSQ